MAVGAASMHVGAISNVVGLWFDRKRALALSLALNGASSGGILVTPALVLAIAHYGFSNAMIGAAAVMAVVLLPAIAFWIGRPAASRPHADAAPAPPPGPGESALRSAEFWSVAAPFALALTAQVGFLVHQIAILEPTHRPRAGRILGRGADHHGDHRAASGSALSPRASTCGGSRRGRWRARPRRCWRSLARPTPPRCSPACVLFGLSAGNLITLPSLVIQREFDAASFGMLVGLSWAISQFTYAFGPGLLGVIRDATGGYTAPLVLCAALDLAAAALILLRPAASRRARLFEHARSIFK